MIDETHAPGRRSWVASAQGHPHFPIQNLPLCVFSPPGGGPRGGVGIGDSILDLAAALEAGLFSGEAEAAAIAASGPALNPLMALGAGPRRALRRRLGELLDADGDQRGRLESLAERLLHRTADCGLHLPAAIGDYTDFYAGIHHAMNVGRQFRPDQPLMPNYKHVPIAYHGRASSIRPSGAPVRRPNGQRKPPDSDQPAYGPSRRLDYELELGVWIGPGNALGEPIPIAEAGGHIAGVCLLNDWSARDLQAWEYQPLGPFLAKNFTSSISPWVVTLEALEPFRTAQAPRPEGDPEPMPYLSDPADQAGGAFDIAVEVSLSTRAMRAGGHAPVRLSRCNARDLYWTFAQMVAHHSSGGCDLHPGDLFGSGTISTADAANVGSLLELTNGGRIGIPLPTGEERRFLEDGDEVVFSGTCSRSGFASIGLGECRGEITPAPA